MTVVSPGLIAVSIISGGQVRAGGCVSLTVTENTQADMFPDKSFTEQLTAVVPFGNVEPESGLQTGALIPGQLSPTTGGAYFTTAEHWPGSLATVMFAGQAMAGG